MSISILTVGVFHIYFRLYEHEVPLETLCMMVMIVKRGSEVDEEQTKRAEGDKGEGAAGIPGLMVLTTGFTLTQPQKEIMQSAIPMQTLELKQVIYPDTKTFGEVVVSPKINFVPLAVLFRLSRKRAEEDKSANFTHWK